MGGKVMATFRGNFSRNVAMGAWDTMLQMMTVAREQKHRIMINGPVARC